MKKVDRKAVEAAIDFKSGSTGIALLGDVINYLVDNGYDFGEEKDLIQIARKYKIRQLYGRILKGNKRKYLPLYGQINLSGDIECISEGAYCTVDFVRGNMDFRRKCLKRTRSVLKTIITRSPLIPEAAAEKLVKAIEEVFNSLTEDDSETSFDSAGGDSI